MSGCGVLDFPSPALPSRTVGGSAGLGCGVAPLPSPALPSRTVGVSGGGVRIFPCPFLTSRMMGVAGGGVRIFPCPSLASRTVGGAFCPVCGVAPLRSPAAPALEAWRRKSRIMGVPAGLGGGLGEAGFVSRESLSRHRRPAGFGAGMLLILALAPRLMSKRQANNVMFLNGINLSALTLFVELF